MTNNIVPGRLPLYAVCTICPPFGAYDHRFVVHFARDLFSVDPEFSRVVSP